MEVDIMRISGVILALSALALVPVGIVHTADQSGRELLAGSNGADTGYPESKLTQTIAVGFIGSQVMARIIENGRETLIVEASASPQLGAEQTLSAN